MYQVPKLTLLSSRLDASLKKKKKTKTFHYLFFKIHGIQIPYKDIPDKANRSPTPPPRSLPPPPPPAPPSQSHVLRYQHQQPGFTFAHTNLNKPIWGLNSFFSPYIIFRYLLHHHLPFSLNRIHPPYKKLDLNLYFLTSLSIYICT